MKILPNKIIKINTYRCQNLLNICHAYDGKLNPILTQLIWLIDMILSKIDTQLIA